jgi:hypothetical protein
MKHTGSGNKFVNSKRKIPEIKISSSIYFSTGPGENHVDINLSGGS